MGGGLVLSQAARDGAKGRGKHPIPVISVLSA